MDDLILILVRLFLLVASITCLVRPTRIIAVIYSLGKAIVGGGGLENYTDLKTKEVMKSIEEDPENFEEQYPWHVGIMRVSGFILLTMFLCSLCMSPPSPK